MAGHEAFAEQLEQLLSATSDTSDSVVGLASTIQTCCTYMVTKGLDTTRIVRSHAPLQLSQLAVAVLKQVASTAGGSSDDAAAPDAPAGAEAGVAEALRSVAGAVGNAVSLCLAFNKSPVLSPELLPAVLAAAAPVTARMRAATAAEPPAAHVTVAASATLQLWHTAASASPSRMVFGAAQVALADSMPVAAELALLLLAAVSEQEQEEGDEGADKAGGSAASASKAGEEQRAYSYKSLHAGLALHLMGEHMACKARLLAAPPGLPPSTCAALASDSVQRALVLHFTALTAYTQLSEGKSGAAEGCLRCLALLGFPASFALAYGAAVSHGVVGDDESDQSFGTSSKSMEMMFAALQVALLLRPEATQGMFAPHVSGAQLALALLEFTTASGVPPSIMQLTQLMPSALDLVTNAVLAATFPVDTSPAEVQAVLHFMVGGLGRLLLLAAGMPAAAVVDKEQQSLEAAASPGAIFTRAQPRLPASSAAALAYLQSKFGQALLKTFAWTKDHSPGLAPVMQLASQQPHMYSRVVEAATRSCVVLLRDRPGFVVSPMLDGLAAATLGCLDAAVPDSSDSLALRLAQQVVTTCKVLEAGLVPNVQGTNAPKLLHCIVRAAVSAQLASAAAAAGQPQPALNAWLADTGRALVTVGRLLELPAAAAMLPPSSSQQWAWVGGHGAVLREEPCTAPGPDLLTALMLHVVVLKLVAELSDDDSGSPRGQPPLAVLHALARQAADLLAQAQPLLERFSAAEAGSSDNTSALAAAAKALSAACGPGGWLPQGLQALGAAVWSAFPQRFACNDPSCDNLEGLSEAASAKKCCTGCKVAHYCCKEHQARHWPLHKSACKHLKAQQDEAPAA